jgi:hypothetical protein
MARFNAWPFFPMYIPVLYGSVYNLVRAGREIGLFFIKNELLKMENVI